jgi:pSer/pThr/pTyr-binding forkhead associated (FHA) protein
VAAPSEEGPDTQRFGADELSRAPAGQPDLPVSSSPDAPTSLRQILVRVQGIDQPIYLAGHEEFRLGRGDPRQGVRPDVDLGPYRGLELGVSRLHAIIKRNGDAVTLTDLGSTNGTTVNGTRLMPNLPQPLRDGDELRLGKLTLRVYFQSG